MKVLHVPFCFRPDRVGGTEVYVEALAHEQLARGVDVVIAAPGSTTETYSVDGLCVHRFATGPVRELTTLYGAGDRVASAGFGAILDAEQPDVVHLHALTSAVSVRTVDEARRRGMRVVFTYHTPTVSCQRGTLLLHGSEVCDGTLRVQRCAECALEALGAGRLGSAMLSRVPAAAGRAFGALRPDGSRVSTAIQFAHLVSTRQDALRAFLSRVERVVVLCEWSRDLLLRNGVAAQKIVLCRHGLAGEYATEPHLRQHGGPLRVAFLGRLHATKGAHVLIRALKRADVELHLFGITQPGDEAYAESLRRLADGDARIKFREPVPSEHVVDLLRDFDVLAVPSQWLETGPLVVLEAYAARTPVIGSRLGGIAELVRDGVDGLLVQHDSVDAWSIALQQLADEPQRVEQLRARIAPPRRMSAVADDLLALYRDVGPLVEAVAV